MLIRVIYDMQCSLLLNFVYQLKLSPKLPSPWKIKLSRLNILAIWLESPSDLALSADKNLDNRFRCWGSSSLPQTEDPLTKYLYKEWSSSPRCKQVCSCCRQLVRTDKNVKALPLRPSPAASSIAIYNDFHVSTGKEATKPSHSSPPLSGTL